MSALPSKRAGLSEQPVGAELMLADEASGRVHVLNPTTAVIWRALDTATTESDLSGVLQADMTVPPGTDPAAIVRRALQLLESKGLVRYT